MIKRRWGWKPDRPDSRDIPYMALRPMTSAPIELPPLVDLRVWCPEVYDQGSLGSCTAQAIIGAYEFLLIKSQEQPDVSLSTLFLYYNERVVEGTVEIDNGAYIRDGIKSLNDTGVCCKGLWPYITQKFAERPTDEAYAEAATHQALVYASVHPDYRDVCIALADGLPVIFGFTVYESFMEAAVAKTGILEIPKRGERAVGGHAVLAVGYDMATQMLLVRNSWGINWGIEGYFWMPFAFIRNLARDFWCIKQVE